MIITEDCAESFGTKFVCTCVLIPETYLCCLFSFKTIIMQSDQLNYIPFNAIILAVGFVVGTILVL
jgi:hypothetical protein